jgi:bifunctional non-homologous end joining protein LigD
MYVQVENEEIAISNPDKELFPGITKWRYIQAIGLLAPYLLRYSRDRLLTTIRFPDGIAGESFYQKNVPLGKPAFVKSAQVANITYILLQNTATLIWLANLACLEFHTSFHLYNDERPTELVFDLDPTGSSFAQVCEVACYTREWLLSVGLDGVVKTSGATGLQIYVPLKPIHTFEETRQLATFVAKYLAAKYPSLITIERKRKDRDTKVYFDYLQHWRGKTLIAPYSPRATRHATVSTPLTWDELAKGIQPTDFTLTNLPTRLAEKGDLFASVDNGVKYELTPLLQFIQNYGTV